MAKPRTIKVTAAAIDARRLLIVEVLQLHFTKPAVGNAALDGLKQGSKKQANEIFTVIISVVPSFSI